VQGCDLPKLAGFSRFLFPDDSSVM